MQKVKCFKIGIYIFKRFFAKSVNLKIYSLFCIPKKKKKKKLSVKNIRAI